MSTGLTQQGIPPGVAHDVGALPPVATPFSAVLGVNPLEHLLGADGGADRTAHRQPTDDHRPGVLPPLDRRALCAWSGRGVRRLCDPCRAGGDRVVAAGPTALTPSGFAARACDRVEPRRTGRVIDEVASPPPRSRTSPNRPRSPCPTMSYDAARRTAHASVLRQRITSATMMQRLVVHHNRPFHRGGVLQSRRNSLRIAMSSAMSRSIRSCNIPLVTGRA
jgi:hypothetical protein